MLDEHDLVTYLTAPSRPPVPLRAVTIFAHPDDETIACGALLSRFAELRVVLVTDGAPDCMFFARRRGYASAEAYAEARTAEFARALQVARLGAYEITRLGLTDGSVVAEAAALTEQLADVVADADVVVTHAYEGGHTDHDAVALAVHVACANRETRPILLEAPLYNLQNGQWTAQTHPASGEGRDLTIDLTPHEEMMKRQMFACFASQRPVLTRFDPRIERFRLNPTYDFSQLPNAGELLYAQSASGMSGEEWLRKASPAIAMLHRRGPVLVHSNAA